MRTESEKNVAFAAGKLAAEDWVVKDDDPLGLMRDEYMAFYGLRISEIPEDLREEFKEGWDFCVENIGNPNYRRTPEMTRARVKRLVEGRHQIEETPAQIIVAPATVNRLSGFLDLLPAADMDSVVNLALDTFDLFVQGQTSHGLAMGLTEEEVRRRFHRANEGKTYAEITAVPVVENEPA